MKHSEQHFVEVNLEDVPGVSLSHNYSSTKFSDQRLNVFGTSKEECYLRLQNFYKKLGEALEESLD